MNNYRKNKRKKVFGILVAVIMSISVFAGLPLTANADDTTGFDSGTGTSENPYIIKTAEQLRYLADEVNGGNDFADKYIRLDNDIDLDNVGFTPIGGGARMTEEGSDTGTAEHKFKGTFDGNGKTIKKLLINAVKKDDMEPNFTGLFGFNMGTIKDFTLEGSLTVTTTSTDSANPVADYIGSVAGFNAGTISGVHSKVAVSARYCGNTGGIAGLNTSGRWREDTKSSGGDKNRTIEDAVGLIINCRNDGEIKGGKKIGGITGVNEGAIKNSANNGDIYTWYSGSGNGQGGIAGRNGCNNAEWGIGTITNCYNTGAINTKARENSGYFDSRWIAGIASFSSRNSRMVNCYSIGEICKGYNDYDPLISRMDNPTQNVSNCYTIEGLLSSHIPAADLDNGKTVAGYTSSYSGTVMTEAQMKAADFLNDLGGAFVSDGSGESAINNGFPILRWQAENPVTVKSIELVKGPNTTTYVAGQTFNPAGMELKAVYTDGSTYTLTPQDYTISNTGELTTEDKKITISGTFEGISFSEDIPITVIKNELAKIELWTIGATGKLKYPVRGTFDPTGYSLRVTYSNGKTATMTCNDIIASLNEGDDFTYTKTPITEGENTITLSYTLDGITKEERFTVTGIDIPNAPEKEEGTNRYLITSADELKTFAIMVSQLGMTDLNARLAGDIDASGVDLEPIGMSGIREETTAEVREAVVSKTANNRYAGKFDGNDKTITLGMERSSQYTGLFGDVLGAVISDLTVAGSVKSTAANTGALVGYAGAGTSVSRCINNAAVNGTTSVGGIIGAVNGEINISSCENNAAITGAGASTGGIAGNSNKAMISGCVNNGNVSTTGNAAGGIAGTAGAGKITKSSNTGDITGAGNVGGIAGAYNSANGTAELLFNTGSIKATHSAGGIYGAGYINLVKNCYNQGDVTATAGSAAQGAGGLVGTQGPYALTIENAYNTGVITGSNGTIKTGGLMGYSPARATPVNIDNSYYLNTSASSAVGLAAGTLTDGSQAKTSDEMKSLAASLGDVYRDTDSYPEFTWDFKDEVIQSLKNELLLAGEKIEEITDALRQSETVTETLRDELAEAEEKAAELQDEINSLEQKDSQSQAEITRLEAQLNELKAEITKKTEDINQMIAENEDLKRQLDELKAEITKKTEDLNQMTAENEDLKRQLDEAENKVNELTEDLDRTNEQSQTKIRELEQEVSDLTEELETLRKEAARVDIARATIGLANTAYTYTGKAISPKVTVEVENTVLEEGTDYTITLTNNIGIGSAVIELTGIGDYKGVITKTYSIVPGKVTNVKVTKGAKKLTVKYRKLQGGVKYQVAVRMLKNGKWKNYNAKAKTTKVIKNLKSKKTYQVKVRAFKKVRGKTYYGAWSKVKKVKVK